nr:hypothetical protein [Campylobacter showae]
MNLTKEPVNKLVLRLAAPAGVAMSFNTLYNVTGVFFAARISTQALAGFSMSFLLYHQRRWRGAWLWLGINRACRQRAWRRQGPAS